MAASGFTPISLYYSATASAVPLAANLVAGELSLNTNDGKLYFKNSSNVVTLLAGATSGPAGGSNTQVQFNSSGVLAGSANMTFNGTTLTAAGFSGPLNGTVGATTPSTGSFTSLAYSTTLTGGTGIVNLGSGQFYKDASGFVGIGTSSPVAKLVVAATGGHSFEFVPNNTTDTNWLQNYNRTTSAYSKVVYNALNHQFKVSGTDAAIIDSSGNVGIGTSSPNNIRLSVDSGAANYSTSFIKGSGALPDNNDNAVLYVLHSGTAGTGFRLRTDQALTGSNFAHVLVNNVSASINGLQVSQYGTGYIASFDKSGTVALRIDNSGNVGIGTTPGKKLDVFDSAATSTTAFANQIFQLRSNGSGADATIQFTDSVTYNSYFGSGGGNFYWNTTGAERMRIASNGYVGIQNTVPAAPLHVGPLIGTGSLNGYTRFALESTDYAVATWKCPAANFSQIIFTDTTTTSLGGINYFNSTNATPNAMAFLTAGSERMRIDTSGNVGIGTNTPNSKLNVAGRVFAGGSLTSNSGDPDFSAGGSRAFMDWNGSLARIGTVVGGGSGGPVAFYVNGGEAARIDTSGNVGIGTTSPIRKLTVSTAGTAEFVLQDTSQAANSRNWRIFNAANTLYFGTLNDAGTAGNDYLYINSSGNVGIGGGTPGSNPKLSMYGGIRFMTTEAAANTYTGIGSIVSDTVSISTSGSERMRITSGGQIGVNTTTFPNGGVANFNFDGFSNGVETVWSGTTSIYHVLVRNANGFLGGINTSGSTTSYTNLSDYRVKENIEPMQNALGKINLLKPCAFTYKVDGKNGQGFIAHELQEVFPDAVVGEKDAVDADGNPRYQGIDTSFLVATLTAAIQEQQTLIAALTARVGALEELVKSKT